MPYNKLLFSQQITSADCDCRENMRCATPIPIVLMPFVILSYVLRCSNVLWYCSWIPKESEKRTRNMNGTRCGRCGRVHVFSQQRNQQRPLSHEIHRQFRFGRLWSVLHLKVNKRQIDFHLNTNIFESNGKMHPNKYRWIVNGNWHVTRSIWIKHSLQVYFYF